MNVKKCDQLWAKVVKHRAGHRCEICGKEESLQSHHIIPRTNYALRFDINNGVCLCVRHHLFFAHKDVLGFYEWVKTKRNLNYLESKRGNRSKCDYQAIYLYLQSELKKI